MPKWVPLVLFVNLAVALYYVNEMRKSPGASRYLPDEWTSILGEVLLLLAYLATCIQLLRRPRPFVAGIAAGLALLSAGTLVVLSGLMWSDGAQTMARIERVQLWMRLLALADIAACVWALTAMLRHREWVAEIIAGGVVGLHLPRLALWMGQLVGMPLDVMGNSRRNDAELALVRDVIAVQQCAFSWADAHPEGAYPATLEALGAAGSGCLGRDVARGRNGRALRYLPRATTGGVLDAFVIEGELPKHMSHPVFHVIGDDLGLVRRWSYRSAAHDWDRTDQVPLILGDLRDCLELLWSGGGLPATAEELARAVPAVSDPRCVSYAAKYLGDSTFASDHTRHGFRFTYAATNDGYRLEARPLAYGETAMRSYLMTDADAMHVTLEDRPATTSDWRLPDCLPHDIDDCVPTAATATPRAALLHDSVIEGDRKYRLYVRVEGDITRLPRKITWAWDCNVPADHTELPVPANLNRHRDYESCERLDDSRPLPLGDRVIVRLWLRGVDGTIAWRQDTIPVEFR